MLKEQTEINEMKIYQGRTLGSLWNILSIEARFFFGEKEHLLLQGKYNLLFTLFFPKFCSFSDLDEEGKEIIAFFKDRAKTLPELPLFLDFRIHYDICFLISEFLEKNKWNEIYFPSYPDWIPPIFFYEGKWIKKNDFGDRIKYLRDEKEIRVFGEGGTSCFPLSSPRLLLSSEKIFFQERFSVEGHSSFVGLWQKGIYPFFPTKKEANSYILSLISPVND